MEKYDFFESAENFRVFSFLKKFFLLKTNEKSMKINDFHEKSIEKSEINFFDRLIMRRDTSSEAFWDLICIPKNL